MHLSLSAVLTSRQKWGLIGNTESKPIMGSGALPLMGTRGRPLVYPEAERILAFRHTKER